MLLTISTTHQPATDLGFLLHKHPGRHHVTNLPFGTAHVVYPEATDERCCVAILVEVDPVGLVRDNRALASRFALARYVNDRPYVASSLLSVALGRLFGTAMSGRSKERQELADRPIPVEAWLPAAPCRGGADLARRLFEPLGYDVAARALPLDPQFPDWGDSALMSLRITGEQRVRHLLEHLFVLLPVLDDDKHYWVGADEVAKLLRRGDPWLAAHPARDLITRRYLRHNQRLTRDALAMLFTDEAGDPDRSDEQNDAREESVERPVSLHTRRLTAVLDAIVASGARSVLDLGCGGGKLLAELVKQPGLERIVGLDVSYRSLEAAARRLHLDRMAPRQRERVELRHGSLTYRDRELTGFDAAAVVEVIEHLDPPRIASFERNIFGHARPGTVIMTTPNAEYNVLLEGLAPGSLRHRDHRFEWTRRQFADWAQEAAGRHGYQVELSGIGPEGTGQDGASVGCPSQLAVFRR